MLEVFQEHKVHLVTQAANDLNLTFVVSSEHAYRLVQQLHGLLVAKFEGGVFGSTWEELTGRAPAPAAPKPWWVKKKAQLLEIGAEREADLRLRSRQHRDGDRSAPVATFRGRGFLRHQSQLAPGILELVNARGLNFECVSPGEIAPRARGRAEHRSQTHSVHAEFRTARGVRLGARAGRVGDARQPISAQAVGRRVQGQGGLRPYRHGPRTRPPRARAHGRRALEVRRAAVRDR